MIQVIAIGQLKSGPEKILCDTYLKRCRADVKLIEIKSKSTDTAFEESRALTNAIKPSCTPILLDERGHDYSTIALNALLEKIKLQGQTPTFLIGGASGPTAPFKQTIKTKIRFGAVTWPHKFVRFMLLEQLYRCLQIQKGHPYHKA